MPRILLLLHSLMNCPMGRPLAYLPILVLFSPSHNDVHDDIDVIDDDDDNEDYDNNDDSSNDDDENYNKKLSYCWEPVRRESMPSVAEMDVEMTSYDLQMYFKVIKSGTN